MFEKDLGELEYISKAAGIPVDYTQGGGGNTSAKLDGKLMAVKASGFKLKQITPKEGYVVVNYKNIKNYYENVDLSSDTDFEKESVEFVKSNIVETEGIKTLRPSVEAGFHSILKKFVIHTHSVYANILCCTETGKETVDKIFKGKEYGVIWIPYINPGFCLTLRINEEIKRAVSESGRFPQVIFMENHGLVVSGDDAKETVELHREVNDSVKKYLEIKTDYPKVRLEAREGGFTSRTDYLSQYFKSSKIDADFFDKTVLYPDQLVYLNGSISVDGAGKKLNISTSTGEAVYTTDSSEEAETIEETLLAYLYVLEGIKNSGLPLKTMSPKEIDFIKNWESEAYRKSLVKSLSK
ncbi:rhamnose utilization protein RhaD (predicted bifunctional aldolase and dehydrogenase) [Anaerobacterium chartisolvens]|uniref:Rhamnose utilization protein RhaD (Predicted bifunctional aldolase and dehydrogenase) n=1 Tax=Anaerobacterium chartisolvens TaxID=1297424 RepID=A0A369AVX2_9FIRM|nr:class II aldolase/adducin family protein [Anaerobacterium chartisolvens]RCX13223.1 rhamnose utilization protein RhaD (predicted bifunctional aldolase and dehydrogenase) [Anaerobacterium chartisolvens]